MTDRELLEAAARSIGLDVRWIDECKHFYEHRPHMLPGYWDKWDPLYDDGDALRLAAALQINVMYQTSGVEARVYRGKLFITHQDASYENRADTGTATRRAIVRAAAAISATAHQ